MKGLYLLKHCLSLGLIASVYCSFCFGLELAVTNPGFEDITGETTVGEFTFGELNGWELYDPNTVTSNGDGPDFYIGTLTPFEADPIGNPGVYEFFPDGALEGQRVGIAFNFDGTEALGEYGMYQELTDTLQPFTTYTLEVGIGNIATGNASTGFFPLDGFPGYRVELQAGGVMLDEDDNTLAGTIPDGEFATSTVTFTTGASHSQLDQNLGILLVNLNVEDSNFPDSDLEVDFDDIRIDASPAIAGDFDFSGTVDGTDFLEWQRGFPAIYDESDLADWQLNYGSSAMFANSQSVPEPAAATILAWLALLASVSTRNRSLEPRFWSV